jgi:hypothetical protein
MHDPLSPKASKQATLSPERLLIMKENPLTTLTIPFTRSVTDSELHDLIFGTGALSWSWWVGAKYTTKDASPEGEWVSLTFTHWDPNEGNREGSDITSTRVSPQQIVDAVAECYTLIESVDPQAAQEILNPGDLGVLDAQAADAVLQTAVFGEVVYG